MKSKAKKTGPKQSRKGQKKAVPAAIKPEERFVEDLLARGEAAKPSPEGNLPLSATHAITKEKEDGTVEVKRARFKLY